MTCCGIVVIWRRILAAPTSFSDPSGNRTGHRTPTATYAKSLADWPWSDSSKLCDRSWCQRIREWQQLFITNLSDNKLAGLWAEGALLRRSARDKSIRKLKIEGILKRYPEIGDRPTKALSSPPEGSIEPLKRFCRTPKGSFEPPLLGPK